MVQLLSPVAHQPTSGFKRVVRSLNPHIISPTQSPSPLCQRKIISHLRVKNKIYPKMQPLRFDGKVALVTGAGNGLGRAYALAFGERGASVVVNDLGVDRSGSGTSSKAADKVVFEIKAKGGKAVANYDSVEDGEKLIKTALDAFGRIDIVVNNAGILRDKSFARINDDDWDMIHRIHLRGSFMVTRAAWPHMREQKYGRIIMVSSNAGIYGNFGQANYSAAKLGLVGLSNTLSIEGQKYGIQCNTIAPVAGSRLTETVMPKELVEALKAEYVSPLVLYLCHESCEENGSLFELGAGWVGKLRWERTKGAVMKTSKSPITPEAVRDNWDKITDFSDSSTPKTVQESTGHLVAVINSYEEEAEEQSSVDTQNMDVSSRVKAFSPKAKEFPFTYTERDAMLYALGVGVSTRQSDYLKFLFELSDDFTVLPTFAVIPGFAAIGAIAEMEVEGLSIDPTKILHGEQYTELYKPLPRSGTLRSTMKVADIVEKKSGLVLIVNVDTVDAEGEKVFFNQYVTFVVGAGPIGAPASSKEQVPLLDAPKRAPDATMTEKTDEDQAALYRLSGDYNPMHIDPAFAAMGGFKAPILHGLCSYGHAVRHVMAKFANNDMNRFKAVKVRFAKPVMPGQSLQTDMWKEGNRIHFTTKVVETGHVCISGAYVDLHASEAAEAQPEQMQGRLKSDAIFRYMQANMPGRPDLISKVNAIFQWNITDNGKQALQWIMDFKTGKRPQLYPGDVKEGKVDCTITVGDEDFQLLVDRKLNAQKAFLSGKIKLGGNIGIAQKLGQIFDVPSKM